MRPIVTMPDGSTGRVFGAATASLQGAGPIIPYWFLVLMGGAMFGALRMQSCRFSVRVMMIAMAFVAIILSVVVTFDL
jgi:hypothetical protein